MLGDDGPKSMTIPAGLPRCNFFEENCVRIRSAQTDYDLIKAFKDILPGYGLETFLFSSFVFGDVTGETVCFGINNWDAELFYRYCRNGAIRRNSLLQQLRMAVVPQMTRQFIIAEAEENEDYKEVHLSLVSAGYDRIAYFPVRSSDGSAGGVRFSGERETLADCEMMQLSYLAQQAFEIHANDVTIHTTDRSILTDREKQCLILISAGLSASEIGEALDISSHTVNYHTSNMCKKLGARNKTHALAIAIKAGYISI
jgi:DNA-binding CsgD family transcriptional regulator